MRRRLSSALAEFALDIITIVRANLPSAALFAQASWSLMAANNLVRVALLNEK
jgi:hypothetical protein